MKRWTRMAMRGVALVGLVAWQVPIVGVTARAATGSLSVSTSSLPDATYDVPYSEQLTATETNGLVWSLKNVGDVDAAFHDAANNWDNNNNDNYIYSTVTGSVYTSGPLTAGQPLTVYYDGTLASASTVNMHFAYNQDFGNAGSVIMTKSGNGWKAVLNVPQTEGGKPLTELSLWFDDGNNHWDSGGGGNYNLWVGTTPLVPGQYGTITYDGSLDNTSNPPVSFHYGFAGWQMVNDTPMVHMANGEWGTRFVVPGELPPGMTLGPSGLLSGTPESAGTYRFIVSVTDGTQTANYTYQFTVKPQPLPQATAGAPYPTSNKLTAPTGTIASNWAIVTGAVYGTPPTGIAVGTGGSITGTPTAPGTYNFTVEEQNRAGAEVLLPEEITVNPPLQITTTAADIPQPSAGKPFLYTFTSTGGTGAQTWSVTSGLLPSGLQLSPSGVLSGTPKQGGQSTFTVQAKDAAGATSTESYSISVIGASITLNTNQLTAGYTNGNLDITGTQTHFQSGQTTVSLSNTVNGTVYIPASDVTVNSPTDLSVNLPTGDTGLGAGKYYLTVRTGSESEVTPLTVSPYTTTQNNVLWDGIYMNQSLPMYVSNPNADDGSNVTISFRAYSGNLTSALVNWYNTATGSGGTTPMEPGKTFGPYQLWTATVPSSKGGTLWYRINMNSGSSQATLSGDGMHSSDTTNNNFPIPVTPTTLSEFQAQPGNVVTANSTNGDFYGAGGNNPHTTNVIQFVDSKGAVAATVYGTNAAWNSVQFTVPAGLADGVYTVNVDTLVKDADGVVNNEMDRTTALEIGKANYWFNSLKHDSFNSFYRTPFGAVATGTDVTLRLRGPKNLTGATLRVWGLASSSGGTPSSGGETDFAMHPVTDVSASTIAGLTGDNPANYSWWEATIPGTDLPDPATNLNAGNVWYQFQATDTTDSTPKGLSSTLWYTDNGSQNEGVGMISTTPSGPSYQLSVYAKNFTTPNWMKGAVVYEIFPDRFFNGNITNDENPKTMTSVGTVNGKEQLVPIQFHKNWSSLPYWPAITATPGSPNYALAKKLRGDGQWNMDFFGGYLKGIQDKLDYLQSLGVNTLYLTPITQSDSVHKYDTGNFLKVDPGFGTLQEYEDLVKAAKARGMHIILDVALEDTGSNSVYFNRFGSYNSTGAWQQYESQQSGSSSVTQSVYYNWYQWNPPGSSTPYQSWFGYDTLPLANTSNPSYQAFADHVGQYWIQQGASGWRLDSADNSNFSIPWWNQFRQAVKKIDPNAVIVGEIWNNPTQDNGVNWLQGTAFDSVMNYQFRNAVLDFFAGNYDDGNVVHHQVNASGFNQELMKMYSEYPMQSMYDMMNLVDSHDTMRILTVLEGAPSPDNPSNTPFDQATFTPSPAQLATGIAKLKLLSDFQYAFPGDPTVYYGDEAGLGGYKDPMDRQTYPWGKQNEDLLSHYRLLGSIRQANPVLQTGGFTPLYMSGNVYAFARTITGGHDIFGNPATNATAIMAMNNSTSATTVTIPVKNTVADGTQMLDELTNTWYTVTNGEVTVPLGAYGGVILISNPSTPVAHMQSTSPTNPVTTVNWTPVAGATGYQVEVMSTDASGKSIAIPYGPELSGASTSENVSALRGASAMTVEVDAVTPFGDVASNAVTIPAQNLTLGTVQAALVSGGSPTSGSSSDGSGNASGNVVLSWSAVPNASSYVIYGQDSLGNWILLKTIPASQASTMTAAVPASSSPGGVYRVAAQNADDIVDSSPITPVTETSESNVMVTPDKRVGNVTSNWRIDFTTGAAGALVSGQGTVTVSAPQGTMWPADASKYRMDGASVQAPPMVSGGTVTITVPKNIAASSKVHIQVQDVVTPAPGSYAGADTTVNTSADTVPTNPAEGFILLNLPISGKVVYPLPIGKMTFTSLGGIASKTVGGTNVTMDVPPTAFSDSTSVVLTTTMANPLLARNVPQGERPLLGLGVNFFSTNPAVPVTLVINNSAIPTDAKVYAFDSSGQAMPVATAVVSAGQAVILVQSDENLVITVPATEKTGK